MSRFPGFVLPCLGVHPVQEVSPEEQRSVTLKVKNKQARFAQLGKAAGIAPGKPRDALVSLI